MNILKDKKKWSDILRLLRRGVRHLFLHNGWVKLLAVVISILLWAGLIAQDPNVIRNKTFQNVDIEIVGQDALKKKGRIVTTDLNELLKGITLTAAVPQLQYEDAEASAYNLRVDLSGIRNTGEQEVRILSDNSSEYGDVVSISKSSVKVNVEEYFTNPKVPITFRPEGESKDWYITQTTVAPLTVPVSGPISIVKEVSRGIVTLNMEDIQGEEGTNMFIAEIRLQGLKGNTIDSSLLTIQSEGNVNDSVIIQAEMLPTVEFEAADLIQITGELPSGYSVEYSPKTIKIAGSRDIIQQLKEYASPELVGDDILESRVVNVDDLKTDKVFYLKTKTFEDRVIVQPSTGSISLTLKNEGGENQTEGAGNEDADKEAPPVTEP